MLLLAALCVFVVGQVGKCHQPSYQPLVVLRSSERDNFLDSCLDQLLRGTDGAGRPHDRHDLNAVGAVMEGSDFNQQLMPAAIAGK